ncbi:MAG: hypothetical protein ABIR46_01910, partial [Candidatus Saccharimonadales bacterium]
PEHYVEPTTPLEQLEEELRLYKDSDSMCLSVNGMKNHFCRTPIYESLDVFAHLIIIAKGKIANTGNVNNFNYIDEDFLDGSIYALHAIVKPSPIDTYNKIVGWNPLGYLDKYKDDSNRFDPIIDEMVGWEAGEYKDAYGQQSDVMQERILEVAFRIRNDGPDVDKKQDAFISGFMFGSVLLTRFGYANNLIDRPEDKNDADAF